MSEVNVDDVIRKYISIRDQRSELKRQYELEDAIHKAKLEQIEKWLLAKQKSIGVTQLKTESGIAFQQTKNLYTCVDWGAFHKWIIANNRLDMLEKRVGQRAVAEFREDSETIPPGINCYSELQVSIRRGK